MHLQLTGGPRGVDPFIERHERDAERLEFLEQRNQVPEIAAEPIQTPHDKHVEALTETEARRTAFWLDERRSACSESSTIAAVRWWIGSFTFHAAAYNLVRLRTLLARPV